MGLGELGEVSSRGEPDRPVKLPGPHLGRHRGPYQASVWSDLCPVLDLTAERPVKTAPGPLGSPFPAASLQGLQLPQSDSLVRALLLDSFRRARWWLLGRQPRPPTGQSSTGNLWVPASHHLSPRHHMPVILLALCLLLVTGLKSWLNPT